jgi:glutathione S-transferase
MLEEVGQPYRTEVVDYATRLKSPEYLAVNPMGKLPTVVHGGVVVTECAAICAYLADVFPEAGLAPPHGDKARGPYYRWLFFAAGPIEAGSSNKAMGWEAPPERKRMLGYGDYEDMLNGVEHAVSGRQYLAGDRFSAADVYFASHLNYGMQFGMMPKRPAFVGYVEPLLQRPAALRANEIDDALVKEMQTA